MVESGSMFLVELMVPELRSYVKCKDFLIKSQFADVFSVILKDPKELEKISTKKNLKRKTKVRKNGKSTSGKSEFRVQSGQSVLIADDIDCLTTNMKMYPMELSLWSKTYPKYKVASTSVPWNSRFIEYIEKTGMGRELQPLSLTGDYNVFDEVTSRRMAVIRLNIKMSYLPNSLTVHESDFLIYDDHDLSRNSSVLQPVQEKQFHIAEETGIIKTSYSGGKKIKKKSKYRSKVADEHNLTVSQTIVNKVIHSNSMVHNVETENVKKINSSIITLVKSDTDIDKNRQIDLMKCKSCLSMNENIDILNYIFGDPTFTFGNQVYCVNYFTVEDAKTDTPSSKSTPKSTNVNSPQTSISPSPKISENLDKSEKSSVQKSEDTAKTTPKISEGLEKSSEKRSEGTAKSPSIDSLDLPKELKPPKVSEIKECKDVTCKFKQFRKLPAPPDDRILLDLSSLNQKCCDKNVTVIKKVEKVVGGMIGMIGKMGTGEDPCYCECQCKYGFTKETRYCKICGGYEIMGEEFKEEIPFPCPIYHNLDKPKIKPSITSDTKKLTKSKSGEKSIESDKETKKGKKKKKEDKFKFNYGYTAPHIGHHGCALPCTGTLGAVPKSMGWLWTAEDIPGMKVAQGWKPGAISKRLLKKLNEAKTSTLPVKTVKLHKKIKRNVESKPTLIVSKMNGAYHIEMQVSPANSEANIDQCSPVKYTVKSEDNENRVQKRLRKRHRLIKEAVEKVWSDPYHPEVCERTCLKAYKQAIGLLPYDPNNPECNCCSEEEIKESRSSSCDYETDSTSDDSSLDLQWEIHFTPPSAKS